MKLQNLLIHNIASIEDAEVNFNSEPLKSAEVFLICGKTGSGKSTILDAITLALYGCTPRLENSNYDKGKYDQDGDDISLKSPKQLMRRGSGECAVSLTFEGNNGAIYTAEWALRRARNKPEGRLQEPSRTLSKQTSDGITNFSKKDDIDAEILYAVGLEFDEFCRTTMLAQGAFTQFLNSSDQDKAAILEKVTGVDIYSKIGMAIFDIHSSKEAAYKEIATDIEKDKPLPEEKRAELFSEGNVIDEKKRVLDSSKNKFQTIIQWLADETKLSNQIHEARNKLHEAKAATETDTFISTTKTIQDWTRYADQRKDFASLTEKEKDLSNVSDSLNKLLSDYCRIRSLRDIISEDIAKIDQESVQLKDAKESKSRFSNIYNKWGAISQLIYAVLSAKSDLELLSNNNNKLNTEILPIQVAIKEDDDRIGELDSQLKEVSNDIEILSNNEKFSKLSEAISRKANLENRISALDNLTHLINNLNEIIAVNNSRKETVKQLEATHKEATDLVAKLKSDLIPLEVAAQTAEKTFDLTKATVDDWAKSIRAGLNRGDTCPVCRQKILNDLPSEDHIFNDLILPLQNAIKDAQNRVQNQKTKIEVEELNLSKILQNISLNKENIEQEEKRINADSNILKEKCDSLQISYQVSHDDLLLSLDNDRNASTKEIERLSAEIKSGEEIASTIEKKRKLADNLHKEKSNKQTEKETLTKKLSAIEQHIASNNGAIISKNDLIKNNEQRVTKEFKDLEELANTNLFSQEFCNAMESDVKQYEKTCDQLTNNDTTKKQLSEELKQVYASCTSIENTLPEWSEHFTFDVTARAQKEAILQSLLSLVTDISNNSSRLKSLSQEATKLRSDLESLFHAGDISRDALVALCDISAEQIEQKQSEIKKITDEYSASNALLQEIETKLKQHNEIKPEFENENETIDSARQKVINIEKEISTLDQRKGAIDNQLKADDEKREKMKENLDRLNAALEELNSWKDLNNLFGSKDGRKFRNIAQSYILENLISNANHYLKTLMPRYQLHVLPGTFVIMVADAYQGYVRRAVSNISGGESFMVSLALALALADVGQKLAVDTLFIDEGFGTLSGEPLQYALNTLHNLHSRGGRRVGIISHVDELAEKIPVKIIVDQPANSSASVVLIGNNL